MIPFTLLPCYSGCLTDKFLRETSFEFTPRCFSDMFIVTFPLHFEIFWGKTYILSLLKWMLIRPKCHSPFISLWSILQKSFNFCVFSCDSHVSEFKIRDNPDIKVVASQSLCCSSRFQSKTRYFHALVSWGGTAYSFWMNYRRQSLSAKPVLWNILNITL